MRKSGGQGGNVIGAEERVMRVFIHTFMVLLCAFIAYTFAIVIGSSLQSQSEIYAAGYRVFPKELSLEAYSMIFRKPGTIVRAYYVTFISTLLGVVIGLIATAGYAYVISRRGFRYKKLLSFLLIFSMLFNGGLVASYLVNTRVLRLYDSVWALVLPLVFNPWNVLLMKSFFSAIPEAVIESARIDGSGEMRTFVQIVVPMSKPVLATIALFLTLMFWNDYQQSLLYVESEGLYKLQYMLMKILMDLDFLNSAAAVDLGVSVEAIDPPALSARMAMCVIAAGPILIVFPFFQKYFVKGISLGSVKE